MPHDPDLTAALGRLAAADPLDPINPTALLERGRRGRRRRRALSISGVVAGVAAIAVGAALLPGALNTTEPEIAQTPTPAPSLGLFTPIPGVPQGDAALVPITRVEMLRRCELRYGTHKLASASEYTATTVIPAPEPGSNIRCMIPGDSQPTKAAIAAATVDPVPADAAGQLRNCSVEYWHDVTKWRVITSDRVRGAGAVVVALSPSGRYSLTCRLSVGQVDTVVSKFQPTIKPTLNQKRRVLDQYFPSYGGTCPSKLCAGYYHRDGGRVASTITRIRLLAANGNLHDIPVKDGWFALAWADATSTSGPLTITEYDRSGTALRTFHSRNW